MLGHEIPGPSNGVGNRVVTRLEHGHELVANLYVAHQLTGLLVASPEEQRDQVTIVGVIAPPLFDHAKNELLEDADRAPKAEAPGDAKPRCHPDWAERAQQIHVLRASEKGVA